MVQCCLRQYISEELSLSHMLRLTPCLDSASLFPDADDINSSLHGAPLSSSLSVLSVPLCRHGNALQPPHSDSQHSLS